MEEDINEAHANGRHDGGSLADRVFWGEKAGCVECYKTECRKTPTHGAHMAVNGECPMCGHSDPNQTKYMSIEEAEAMFG